MYKKKSAVEYLFALQDREQQPVIGITPTVTISKNGGSFVSVVHDPFEVGKGFYKVMLTAEEMDADAIALQFVGTGAVSWVDRLQLVASF